MESVDMHVDEPQQAEPEEDLDISEFREDKPQNISQDDFPGTDVWMEQSAEIAQDDQPMDIENDELNLAFTSASSRLPHVTSQFTYVLITYRSAKSSSWKTSPFERS